MNKTSPNLNEDFIDYLADVYPDVAWSKTYIHWHESVSEYCVYIDDKWKDYVPEEYIFKAGYQHYKLWADAWAESSQTELEMDVIRTNVRALIKFCTEKGTVPSDYMDYVRYFVDTIRCRSLTPDMQNFALEQAKNWFEKHDYTDGVRLMVQEIGNTNVKNTRV